MVQRIHGLAVCNRHRARQTTITKLVDIEAIFTLDALESRGEEIRSLRILETFLNLEFRSNAAIHVELTGFSGEVVSWLAFIALQHISFVVFTRSLEEFAIVINKLGET